MGVANNFLIRFKVHSQHYYRGKDLGENLLTITP